MNDDGMVLRVSCSMARQLLVLLMTVVWAVPAAAQSVRRVTLDSGLTLIMRDRQVSHVVDVQVVVRAGPQHEDGLLGSNVSRLTQALVVDRLRRVQGGRVAQIAGPVRSSVDVEAARIALSTTDAHLPALLRLVAESLAFRDHDVDDLERHRRRLMSALEQRSDTEALERRELDLLVYRRHPARLGQGGVPRVIQNLQMAQLQAYQAARYTLPNMSVIVVGHVDQEALRRQVAQAFSGLDGGGWQNRPVIDEPPQIAARQHVVTAPIGEERHAVAWRVGSLIDDHDPALRVLAVLLDDPYHSPLQQALESGQLATGLRVRYRPGTQYPGYLVISYTPYQRRGADAWIAIQEILTAMAEGGPGESAVRAARQYLRRTRAQGLASASGIGDDLARWEVALGLPTYGDRLMERVQTVDAAAIKQAIRDGIRSDNRCRLVLRPPEDTPTSANAGGVVKTLLGDVPPEMTTLDNGVRVVHQYLPVGLVHLRVTIGGGAALEEGNSLGATAVVRRMFERGAADLADSALARRLAADGMTFEVGADHHGLYLSLTCFPEDAERGVRLLMSIFAQPSQDVEAVERAGRDAASTLTHLFDDIEPWRRRLLERLREAMLDGHYTGRSTTVIKNAIEELAPQQVLDFLRRLRSGDHIIVSLFGEVDAARTVSLVKDLMDGISLAGRQAAAPGMAPDWGADGIPSGTIGVRWDDQELMAIAFAWPGLQRSDLAGQQAVLDLLLALLDDGLGGGYLRRALGDQVAAWRFMVEPYTARGLVLLSMIVEDGEWGAVRGRLADAMTALPDFLAQVDDEALEAARQRCHSRRALAMDDLRSAADLYTTALLRDGDMEVVTGYGESLTAARREDLVALANRIFAALPMVAVMARSPERVVDDAAADPVQTED